MRAHLERARQQRGARRRRRVPARGLWARAAAQRAARRRAPVGEHCRLGQLWEAAAAYPARVQQGEHRVRRSSTRRGAALRAATRARACAHRCEHESTRPPTETSLVSHTMQPPAGSTFMRRRVIRILRGTKISHQSWPNGSLAAQSSLPWLGATWSAREPSVGLGAGHGWSSRGEGGCAHRANASDRVSLPCSSILSKSSLKSPPVPAANQRRKRPSTKAHSSRVALAQCCSRNTPCAFDNPLSPAAVKV